MALSPEQINYDKLSRILDVVTEILHDAIQTKYPDVIEHLQSCYDRKSPARIGDVYQEFDIG
jgi:hypothetical protein